MFGNDDFNLKYIYTHNSRYCSYSVSYNKLQRPRDDDDDNEVVDNLKYHRNGIWFEKKQQQQQKNR